MTERTCTKCGETKPETPEFFRRRGTKYRGGLRPDCRVCSAARDAAYYKANRARWRAYYLANAERISRYQAAYWKTYQSSPEGKAANRRAKTRWKAAGGLAVIARAAQRRRSRKRNLPAEFTAADWSACLEWFEGVCCYCGKAEPLTQDHAVPVTAGGGYVPENILPACGSCNSRKNTAEMESWFRKQKFFSEERLMLIQQYIGEFCRDE